jgi:hypothetical protein
MLRNANCGWYQSSKIFTIPKRLEIGYEYLDMCFNQWPGRPSRWLLATKAKAKISQSTARKIITELENSGSVLEV